MVKAVDRVKTKLGEAAIWAGIAAVVLGILAFIATTDIGASIGAAIVGLLLGFFGSLIPKG